MNFAVDYAEMAGNPWDCLKLGISKRTNTLLRWLSGTSVIEAPFLSAMFCWEGL